MVIPLTDVKNSFLELMTSSDIPDNAQDGLMIKWLQNETGLDTNNYNDLLRAFFDTEDVKDWSSYLQSLDYTGSTEDMLREFYLNYSVLLSEQRLIGDILEVDSISYFRDSIGTRTEDSIVQPARSYLFDEIDDYIYTPLNISSTPFKLTGNFKLKSGVTSWNTIADNSIWNNLEGWILVYSVLSEQLSFYMGGDTSAIEISMPIDTNVHNFEIIYNGTEISLSIDGGTPETAIRTFSTSINTLIFGARHSNDNLTIQDHFGGNLWNLKISDINDNIIAWYKCDETGDNPTSWDSSGNENHGTKNNVTLSTFHAEDYFFGSDYQNQVGYTSRENWIKWSEDISQSSWDLSGTGSVTGTNTLNMPVVGDSIRSNYSNVTSGQEIFGYVTLSGTGNISFLFNGPTEGSKSEMVVPLTSTPTRYNISHTQVVDDVMAMFIKRRTGQTDQVTITDVQFNIGIIDDYQKTEAFSAIGLTPRDESDITKDVLGNDLEFNNRAKYNALIKGSNCGTFDGVDDLCLADALNCASKDTAFSIMAKINITDTVTRQTVLNNALASDDIVGINFESNTVRFGVWNGSSYFISESESISVGINEIIATFDGSTTGKLYLNGVEATGSNSPNASSTVKFAIGSRTDGSGVIDGSVWDVRVFDRVITSDERTAYGNNKNISSPVAYYPFAEGGGTKIYDVSGNDNHGTAQNITEATFWGTKQDVFHYNLLEGHSIYEHATSTLLRVPYVINGQPLSITPPSGYTKTSDNPAGNWHNNSENYIEQQQVLELVQADIETKYWYGTNLAKGLIASDWTNLTNTTLTDDPDGSILSTTSVAGQTGFNDGTFFTADIEYVVRFRAKSNVNQGTAFTSIGDTSDLGTDPTNPNITTEYQAYEFHITPTSAAMRIYMILANIGDSFNVLDLQITAINNNTANPIYYDDIVANVYTDEEYNKIFSNVSTENEKRNILTYSEEQTGDDLLNIKKYLNIE